MKGKLIKTDKEWLVEIQSDLHGYGIGWGDNNRYPLFITDEDIWEGKEVEVEFIEYNSSYLPVLAKIKEKKISKDIFYLGSEYDQQIKRMEAIGVNTTGQTFEQMVNTLLVMVESEVSYWKFRCEKAEEFIEWSPCDPDITEEQLDAYNQWQHFVNLKR